MLASKPERSATHTAPKQDRFPPTLLSTHYRRKLPSTWKSRQSIGKCFFDLPAEIRNTIYDYALSGLQGTLVKSKSSKKQLAVARFPVTLLLVSKKVCCEAPSVLMWNNWVHPRYGTFDLLDGSEWDHLRMLVIEWEQDSGPELFAMAARMPHIQRIIFRARHFSFRQLKGVVLTDRAFPKLLSLSLIFTERKEGKLKWYGAKNEKLHPAIQLRFGDISKDEFLEWKWFVDMCEYFEKCQRWIDFCLMDRRRRSWILSN